MAEVQFEDDQYQQVNPEAQKPFFTRLVLRTGLVSTDQQAQYVLVALVIIAIGISVFFLMSGRAPRPPSADKIIWVAAPDATPSR